MEEKRQYVISELPCIIDDILINFARKYIYNTHELVEQYVNNNYNDRNHAKEERIDLVILKLKKIREILDELDPPFRSEKIEETDPNYTNSDKNDAIEEEFNDLGL